jgi:hypothetical protein
LLSIAVQQPLDPVGAQGLTAFIQKDRHLFRRRTLRQPGFQYSISISAEPDHPLFAPFTTHPQSPRLPVLSLTEHIAEFQIDHFAHPQPCPHHQDKPGPVAAGSNYTPHPFQVFVPQVSGQMASSFPGMSLVTHRVWPTQVTRFFGQKVEEGLQRCHPPIDCGRFQTPGSLLVDEIIDIVHANFLPGLLAIGNELA